MRRTFIKVLIAYVLFGSANSFAHVVNAFLQGWIYNWMKKGWKTADGSPVKNKELWEELYKFTRVHEIQFNKVKGHADNELNNRCDELARNAILNL